MGKYAEAACFTENQRMRDLARFTRLSKSVRKKMGPLLGPLLVDAVFDNSEVLKGHNGWASELRIPPSGASNDVPFTLCLQG